MCNKHLILGGRCAIFNEDDCYRNTLLVYKSQDLVGSLVNVSFNYLVITGFFSFLWKHEYDILAWWWSLIIGLSVIAVIKMQLKSKIGFQRRILGLFPPLSLERKRAITPYFGAFSGLAKLSACLDLGSFYLVSLDHIIHGTGHEEKKPYSG